MYILATDPSYYLMKPGDLDASPLPEIVVKHQDSLKTIVRWANEFLCQPHADLGRDGAVCPFVRTSLDKELFLFTVQPGKHLDLEHVCNAISLYRDWYTSLEPVKGVDAKYKTIVVLFPDMDECTAERIVDQAQKALKPGFIARGLMIGQFYAHSNEPGLRNPAFRPLRSPIPLLAIRHIVATDFPFLKEDRNFVAMYLQLFAHTLPEKMRQEVEAVAQRMALRYPKSAQ